MHRTSVIPYAAPQRTVSPLRQGYSMNDQLSNANIASIGSRVGGAIEQSTKELEKAGEKAAKELDQKGKELEKEAAKMKYQPREKQMEEATKRGLISLGAGAAVGTGAFFASKGNGWLTAAGALVGFAGAAAVQHFPDPIDYAELMKAS